MELKKQQAVAQVHRSAALVETYQLEQQAVEAIIDQALAYPSDENRWHAYEDLKAQASQIVGWDAQHESLSTTTHYEVMVAFIDWLLPSGEPEDDDGMDEEGIV